EPQVAALAAERPALTGELERTAVGVELHVVAAHARQLGVEDELVAGLHEVEEGLPAGERVRPARRHAATAADERLLEELVEPLLEPGELAARRGSRWTGHGSRSEGSCSAQA